MTAYFFDSSALVKRYVNEVGSAWVQSVIGARDNMIFIAHITPAKVTSSVMRLARQGGISARSARAVRLLIDRHAMRQYQLIRLTDAFVLGAEDLLEKHALRAADSIQLASALDINRRLLNANLQPLTFVSNDQRLLNTAVAEGLPTDDPMLHP